jgi:hypothetical protein
MRRRRLVRFKESEKVQASGTGKSISGTDTIIIIIIRMEEDC